jgi:SAM-dependent methyltransferase
VYKSTTATHYAAYRPPLHKTILESAFSDSRERHTGLDIGCGTGCSTIALLKYCSHVVGIDPSIEMLKKAQAQHSISYLNASAEKIPIVDNSVDFVSIAGSLNYINRRLLVNELSRICSRKAEIVVYDFDLDLSRFESLLELETPNDSLEYNHQINLSGFPGIQEILLASDEVLLDLSSREITHLLLSDIDMNRSLEKTYGREDVFELVKGKIEFSESMFTLKANIHYSLYSLAAK